MLTNWLLIFVVNCCEVTTKTLHFYDNVSSFMNAHMQIVVILCFKKVFLSKNTWQPAATSYYQMHLIVLRLMDFLSLTYTSPNVQCKKHCCNFANVLYNVFNAMMSFFAILTIYVGQNSFMSSNCDRHDLYTDKCEKENWGCDLGFRMGLWDCHWLLMSVVT